MSDSSVTLDIYEVAGFIGKNVNDADEDWDNEVLIVGEGAALMSFTYLEGAEKSYVNPEVLMIDLPPTKDNRHKIIITCAKRIKMPKKCRDAFDSFEHLQSVQFKKVDFEEVVDMTGMFARCIYLKHVDFGGANFRDVKSMRKMFMGCPDLERVDFGTFNGASEIDISYCFSKYVQSMSDKHGRKLHVAGACNPVTINLGNLGPEQIKEVDNPIIYKDGEYLDDMDIDLLDLYTHNVDWNLSVVANETLLRYIVEHDAKYIDSEFARGRQYFTDWYLREVYDNFLSRLEADTACLTLKKHKTHVEAIGNIVEELYKLFFRELPEHRYSECMSGRNRLGMILGTDYSDEDTANALVRSVRNLISATGDGDDDLPLTVIGLGTLEPEDEFNLTCYVHDKDADFARYKNDESARKKLRELLKYGPGGRRLNNRIVKDLFIDDVDNELTLVSLLARIKRFIQLNVRGTCEREAALANINICMSHAVKVCMEVKIRLDDMRNSMPQFDYIEAYKKKRDAAEEAERKTIELSVQAVQNLDVGKEATCPKCYGAVINGRCTACGRLIHKTDKQ